MNNVFLHSVIKYPILFGSFRHYCLKVETFNVDNEAFVPDKKILISDNDNCIYNLSSYSFQNYEVHPGSGILKRPPGYRFKNKYSHEQNCMCPYYYHYERGECINYTVYCQDCHNEEMNRIKNLNKNFNIVFNNCESIIYKPRQTIILLVAILAIALSYRVAHYVIILLLTITGLLICNKEGSGEFLDYMKGNNTTVYRCRHISNFIWLKK